MCCNTTNPVPLKLVKDVNLYLKTNSHNLNCLNTKKLNDKLLILPKTLLQ